MTKLFNDPSVFMDEMLEGFFDIYPQYVTSVPGGMVRSTSSPTSKVSVVVAEDLGITQPSMVLLVVDLLMEQSWEMFLPPLQCKMFLMFQKRPVMAVEFS